MWLSTVKRPRICGTIMVKAIPPLILQYLGKEVTLSVPVNHQTACLETPFEHWQRYSNEYEAPITRLSVLLPADRFDRSALNRFAKTVKTDVSGCECIWTQEAAPILHISVDGILQQEYSTIIKAALASYERIAGIGEADGPALAIFRDKDSLRILQFKWNSVSYQATYQGTFYLANFGKALLIAPHREDFQAVYGQNASVTLEILVYNSIKKTWCLPESLSKLSTLQTLATRANCFRQEERHEANQILQK